MGVERLVELVWSAIDTLEDPDARSAAREHVVDRDQVRAAVVVQLGRWLREVWTRPGVRQRIAARASERWEAIEAAGDAVSDEQLLELALEELGRETQVSEQDLVIAVVMDLLGVRAPDVPPRG